MEKIFIILFSFPAALTLTLAHVLALYLRTCTAMSPVFARVVHTCTEVRGSTFCTSELRTFEVERCQDESRQAEFNIELSWNVSGCALYMTGFGGPSKLAFHGTHTCRRPLTEKRVLIFYFNFLIFFLFCFTHSRVVLLWWQTRHMTKAARVLYHRDW